jgi:hypothetical protein
VHALGITLGWVLFVWGWQRVLAGHPHFDAVRELIVGAAIVVPVVTLSWIAHNVGIHRRKGARRAAAPRAPAPPAADFHGRGIRADWPALATAQRIEIVIVGEHKLVRPRATPE